MFITPQLTGAQFGFGSVDRKKKTASAPAKQPKQEEVKPLPVSKSVEKQLSKLASEFNKNLDELKKSYQFYTTLVDQNGLRMLSESSIVEEIRQSMTSPPMTTQATNETGFYNNFSNISESLNETGTGY